MSHRVSEDHDVVVVAATCGVVPTAALDEVALKSLLDR
jgi:hypothetical protein